LPMPAGEWAPEVNASAVGRGLSPHGRFFKLPFGGNQFSCSRQGKNLPGLLVDVFSRQGQLMRRVVGNHLDPANQDHFQENDGEPGPAIGQVPNGALKFSAVTWFSGRRRLLPGINPRAHPVLVANDHGRLLDAVVLWRVFVHQWVGGQVP